MRSSHKDMMGGEKVYISRQIKDSLKRAGIVVSTAVISVGPALAGNNTAENTSEAVALASTTSSTVLGLFLQPPLSYFLGLSIFGIVLGYIAGLIKGRRKSKG